MLCIGLAVANLQTHELTHFLLLLEETQDGRSIDDEPVITAPTLEDAFKNTSGILQPT